MSVDPLTASDQRKRTPRKRAKRLAEDGGGYVAPVPSEEKSFRVFLLSRETGIDPDQARELVDSIEGDGAALVDVARRMKIRPDDCKCDMPDLIFACWQRVSVDQKTRSRI